MHCYCCDCLLEDPPLDRATGRYYCSDCLSFTTETVLSLEGKERYLEDNVISLDELNDNDNEDQEEPDDVPWA